MKKQIPERDNMRLSDNKKKPGDSPEQWAVFLALLGDSLPRWAARLAPPVPHIFDLEQLVTRHKELTGRRLWLDLLKLWLLGILVISGMVLLLNWNIYAFWFLQIFAVAGAILFFTILSRKDREAKRKWTT
jgi:hypothetical protein